MRASPLFLLFLVIIAIGVLLAVSLGRPRLLGIGS